MCWDLKFFDTGEWQVLDERLWEYEDKGISINPPRGDLFAALDSCPFETCRVAILGQDPYPTKGYATGIAFDIPLGKEKTPPTLLNILKEYSEDLGLPFPPPGKQSLKPWCKQGVLLWNVIPTCYTGQPASHRHWTEWTYLNIELVKKLSDKGIVFVFLGGIAREYLKYVDPIRNRIISMSHPSPLSAGRGVHSFVGSRLFSTINAKLCEMKLGKVEWTLPS
jgi:uracil-DNA glycosylase